MEHVTTSVSDNDGGDTRQKQRCLWRAKVGRRQRRDDGMRDRVAASVKAEWLLGVDARHEGEKDSGTSESD